VERWRRSETAKELETQIVEQIEALMMYRSEMPDGGKLRELIRPVAAEAQKEAIEERWIDIQEKCPKECESVLVTWFWEGMVQPVITCGHYVADPGKIIWFRDWTSEVIHPTHWMPLPGPPRAPECLKEQG